MRLRPATEDFDGAGVPSNLTAVQWSPPYGSASAGGGTLAVDGARVQDIGTYPVGEVLEFSATFSGAASQNIGFGVTLDDGPWAIISTGSGGGLGASTRAAPGATGTFDPLPVPVPTARTPSASSGRRPRSATTSHGRPAPAGGDAALSITTPMRPIMSDYTADGNLLAVDSL